MHTTIQLELELRIFLTIQELTINKFSHVSSSPSPLAPMLIADWQWKIGAIKMVGALNMDAMVS